MSETNEKVESEPDAPPEPGPSAASPGPDNEKAASEPGTQPESNPSTGQQESSTVQPESEATTNLEPTQDGSQILINIDKSRQEMTVFVDGIEQYTWPVSTGGPGYATPSGTFTASSMNEVWYSKQWDNAPMMAGSPWLRMRKVGGSS